MYGNDGETVIGTKKDSIVSGTVTASPDGMVFVSYYTDYYTDDNQTTKSYVINLNAESAIDNVAADGKSLMNFRVQNNNILFSGAEKAEVFDLEGRTVAKANDGKATLAKQGMYIVTMTGKNGEKKSQKVVIR